MGVRGRRGRALDFADGSFDGLRALEARGAAKGELADKYGDFGVHPQHGSGSITVGGSQETGLQGAVAHLAIWNRPLSGDEIASIWSAGASDLRSCAMHHSFV